MAINKHCLFAFNFKLYTMSITHFRSLHFALHMQIFISVDVRPDEQRQRQCKHQQICFNLKIYNKSLSFTDGVFYQKNIEQIETQFCIVLL